MQSEDFKYFAFISYSHKDQKIAKKLQRWLEHYHLPSKVIDSHPDLPKKVSPVFIDESDLVARKGSLSESLKGYLNESSYLVIICSPNSAKSPYVNDEADYFINKLGRLDRVIPLIVDGLPHAKDHTIECFPAAIRELPREREPLGIDLKTFGRRGAFLRVMATLLRLNIDYFISRADEERKRRIKIFSGIAAALVVAIGMLIWYNSDVLNLMYNAEAQFDLGNSYLEKNNYTKAAEWFEKASAKGHVLAQITLGQLYEKGLGVAQDQNKAAELYDKVIKQHEKAAAEGNTEANIILGGMYIEGLGVTKDYAKAVEYFEKAAAGDNAKAQIAQIMLGDMYLGKLGTEILEDYAKAQEWYEKAANNGNVEAQVRLGKMYEGFQNFVKAREWYEKAAANDSTEAQTELGNMYYHGLGVREDYAKAAEWYEKAAEKGNSFAQGRLDYIREEGSEAKQDRSKAIERYEKAAAEGNLTAQIELAEIYMEEENYAKAIEWFEKAAANGNTQAQTELGNMYFAGIGVRRDYAKAAEWYEKAAEKGDSFAQGRLDSIREESLGSKQDRSKAIERYAEGNVTAQIELAEIYMDEGIYAKAIEWLEKAANNGDADAQIFLAEIYMEKENYAKAIEWLEKAANNDNAVAQIELAEIYEKGLGVEKDPVKAQEWRNKVISHDK